MNDPILSRRALALGLAALPIAAHAARPIAQPLSADDRALIARAGAYLQDLTEARGRFVQTDARGVTSQGELFLKRPGKARFAYDAPSGLLVVSDGGNVAIADSRLKTFDRYPLMSTPLSIFLAREIRLDRGVAFTRVSRLADGFSLTARDGRKKAEGEITLTFAEAPLRLIGWAVTDATGSSTRIRLVRLERTTGLDPALFILRDPRPQITGRSKM